MRDGATSMSGNRQRVVGATATIVGMTITYLDEVTELFQAVLERPADAPTACTGWTAHDLLAHLAPGADEEAALIEAARRAVRHRAGVSARYRPS